MDDLHLRLIHFFIQDAQRLEAFGTWLGARSRDSAPPTPHGVSEPAPSGTHVGCRVKLGQEAMCSSSRLRLCAASAREVRRTLGQYDRRTQTHGTMEDMGSMSEP